MFSWRPEEEPFISAVRSDLFAIEPKVAYASWLEDQGDSRAAFLRELIEAQENETPFPDSDAMAKDWLQQLGYLLLKEATELGLDEFAEDVTKIARQAIEITHEEIADDQIPIGASKFNGDPDLPADFQWPTYIENPNEQTEVPLLFIAQIALTELQSLHSDSDLPRSGLLSVFGSMGDGIEPRGEDGDCRVFCFPESTTLQRRPQPDCHKEWTYYKPARIAFESGWDLPDAEDDWVDAHPPMAEQLKWNFDDEELVERLRESVWSDSHLFGYSIHQRTCNPSPGPEWQHLLTLGSVCEWCWCDGEHLAIFVHREDMKAGKFDRVFGYCS